MEGFNPGVARLYVQVSVMASYGIISLEENSHKIASFDSEV